MNIYLLNLIDRFHIHLQYSDYLEKFWNFFKVQSPSFHPSAEKRFQHQNKNFLLGAYIFSTIWNPTYIGPACREAMLSAFVTKLFLTT